MNNHGAIQCKVKLLADGEQQEMRRFQLDDSSFASSFDLFREKLRAVFPQLRETAFKVTWTDSDGDVITIGNDEDLLMSMMEMNGLKVLDVHINADGSDAKDDAEEEAIFNPLGSVVTCDVCNNRITRYRYKCLQCHDYDLCLACEQAGNHAHHVMMRLANLEIPRALPKMLGHWSRSARKAAYHAAKEAHRCARSSARAAHAAAAGAATAGVGATRCPFRQGQGAPTQSGPDFTMLDTNAIYDLATSFLRPFTQGPQGQTQTAAPPAQAPPQAQPQPATASATPNQGSGAATGTATPTANAPSTPGAPGDVIGNILRDVFSAINANVAQAQGQSTSTPATPAPTPTATPAPTPTAAAPAPAKDAVHVDLTTNTNTPMDVEPVATAPIYPNVPQGPDAGWTFIPPPQVAQPSAPVVPLVPLVPVPVEPVAAPLNPEEVKYASQLGQLRRMGFSENIDLLGLLKLYSGNIRLVVNHLFEQGN